MGFFLKQKQIDEWRENGFRENDAKDFYNWIDDNLIKKIKSQFEMTE